MWPVEDANTAIVREAAKRVGLLSPSGMLLRVDSMSLVDFVVELEIATGARIDVGELTADSFESIESVVTMLGMMVKGAG
jgi:hypothetical protein